MSDVAADYAAWRATMDGEKVVRYVTEKALALRVRGWRHYGIAALVEAARYDWALEVGPDEKGLKINNDWRAFLAREVMQKNPTLRGFFELRRSKADAAVMRADGVAWPEGAERTITYTADEVLADTGWRPIESRWTVESVPTPTRWACEQPECDFVLTDTTGTQPLTGGYRKGKCPERSCHSNKRTGKERGTTIFVTLGVRGGER